MLLRDLTFVHQRHILAPRRMRLDGNPSVLDRVTGMDRGESGAEKMELLTHFGINEQFVFTCSSFGGARLGASAGRLDACVSPVMWLFRAACRANWFVWCLESLFEFYNQLHTNDPTPTRHRSGNKTSSCTPATKSADVPGPTIPCHSVFGGTG